MASRQGVRAPELRALEAKKSVRPKPAVATTKAALAQAFSDWVVSPEGQATIAAYKIGGEQLFFPNAERN